MSQVMQDTILSVLDTVLQHEPEALEKLIEHRVNVGDTFLNVNSPVVVEVVWDMDDPRKPRLGMLGLINGFLGEDFKICAIFSDEEKLTGFKPVE